MNPSQGADDLAYAAENYAASLRELPGRDPEAAHVQADALIVAFLREGGFTELADAFEAVRKWYA
jgi:hypothetical protein